jgi:hypothetical protein
MSTRNVAPVENQAFWEAYAMSLDDVTGRLRRVTAALAEKSVPSATKTASIFAT